MYTLEQAIQNNEDMILANYLDQVEETQAITCDELLEAVAIDEELVDENGLHNREAILDHLFTNKAFCLRFEELFFGLMDENIENISRAETKLHRIAEFAQQVGADYFQKKVA